MNKEKLKKVIAEEATQEEASQVMDWIATDEGAAAMSGLIQEDIDRADDNFARAWAADIPPALRHNFYTWLNAQHSGKRRWLWVAAAVIPIIIMSALAALFADKSGVFAPDEFVEVAADKGKHMQVMLSDGTLVELNSGSRLRYPKRFALFHRDVFLSGEAFFTVAKDKTSPFKLTAGDVSVNVTGTKFNVEAYEDQDFINVLLDEGSVTLVTPNGKVSMEPAQYVSYNKKDKTCSLKEMTEDDFSPTAWKDNILNFHMTPLRDILNIIARERNVSFVVKDSTLLDSRFTLSSNNEYTAQILHDIEAVSNVKFTFKEGTKNTYIVSK